MNTILQRGWADAMWSSKLKAFYRFTLSLQSKPRNKNVFFFQLCHALKCSSCFCALKQWLREDRKLAVEFSSGSDWTLTSTFRVHCSSLVCINLYDSNGGTHGTASRIEKTWSNLLQHWNHIGLTDVRYCFIGLCSEFHCHFSWLILKCHWISHSWLRCGYSIYFLICFLLSF